MANSKPSEVHEDFDEDYFEWEERDESISYLKHCIAGSVAGVVEHLSLLPFDTIKTHVQVLEGKYSSVETAKILYKNEGFSKFWKGASVLMSGCIPAHAAYFSVYEFAKTKLLPKFHDNNNQIYPYMYAMTGALATLVHDSIMSPFDMLKQRAQIAPTYLSHLRDLMYYIQRNEGWKALYKGLPATLMMNIPQAAVIVGVNETLKIYYRPDNGHNFLTYFVCAAVAGASAAFATIPLDNIRTKLQTQNFYYESRKAEPSFIEKKNAGMTLHKMAVRPFISNLKDDVEKRDNKLIKYRNILQTVRIIIREEGLRGFYRGVIPRILTQAPSSAISWSVYEMMKKLVNSKQL